MTISAEPIPPPIRCCIYSQRTIWLAYAIKSYQHAKPIIEPHDQGRHCHSVRSGCAFRIAAVTSATFPAECGGQGMCLWRLDKLPAEAC